MEADANDGVSALSDLLANDVLVEAGVSREHHRVVRVLLLLFWLRLLLDDALGLVLLVCRTLRGSGRISCGVGLGVPVRRLLEADDEVLSLSLQHLGDVLSHG